MFLKFYPKDVPLGLLVQHNFIALQSTLMRVQELQQEGTAFLSDEDRRALQELIELLERARDDAVGLQKMLVN